MGGEREEESKKEQNKKREMNRSERGGNKGERENK